MLKLAVIALVLAAGAAYATKPGPEAVEAALSEAMTDALARSEASTTPSPGEQLVVATCRIDQTACFTLLRSLIEITYSDRLLYARIDLAGFRRERVCYGAFTTFYCPKGMITP